MAIPLDFASSCDWCNEDRPTDHRGAIPVGRWAVVLRDCPACVRRDEVGIDGDDQSAGGNAYQNGHSDVSAGPAHDEVVPNILCTKHFLEIITAEFPSRCQECGYPRSSLVEVLISALPLDPFGVSRMDVITPELPDG